NRWSDESGARTPPARAWARLPASSTPMASRLHKAADDGGPQPSEPCSIALGVNDARPGEPTVSRLARSSRDGAWSATQPAPADIAAARVPRVFASSRAI